MCGPNIWAEKEKERTKGKRMVQRATSPNKTLSYVVCFRL